MAPLPYTRISQTLVTLPDRRVLEIYITLNAPLPLMTGSDGNYWPDEDPPRVAGHIYQTLVWHDVDNGITDHRTAQDLTVLEET
jgi:hypothetical protein